MPVERVCAMAKILVIDDDPGILNLLDNVLRLKGHEVVLAGHGREGLQLFQQERPHVTILDFIMPDMGGLDVLREIRTLDPHAPAIILIEFGTEEREWQVRKLGVTEFIPKDFLLPFLGAALDRVLKHRGDERRQFPRFWVHFPISLLLDGVVIGDGTGFDLSAWGCAVESQAKVGKGDYYVALQLYLPDHEDPTTPLRVNLAAVRWTVQQKCGLDFIYLPIRDLERLRRYLNTLQTTSP